MATKGTDYFALFMMNHQDRITRSLAQARRELDYMKLQEEAQRDFLMEQIAAERAALAKIRTTKVSFSRGKGGLSKKDKFKFYQELRLSGSAESAITKAEAQAGLTAAQAYELPDSFNRAYSQSMQNKQMNMSAANPAIYGSDYERKVIPDLIPTLSTLSPAQQNQALVEMSRDLAAGAGISPDQAFLKIARKTGISTEGMAPPSGLDAAKVQAAKEARAHVSGKETVLESREGVKELLEETGTGAGAAPQQSTATYLREQAAAAEDRIAALEDQLEELALDPVRMEDIRTRAGEIQAPYMSKRKQKEIEYAKTLRAMTVKGWQKNFTAASTLGEQYANQIEEENKDFTKGSTGEQFAMGLFNQIKSQDITLPQAMARIAEDIESAEEQKKAAAVLVAQGILGSRRDAGPPVPGQAEVEKEIKKAVQQSQEGWLWDEPGWLWDEPVPQPKPAEPVEPPPPPQLEDITPPAQEQYEASRSELDAFREGFHAGTYTGKTPTLEKLERLIALGEMADADKEEAKKETEQIARSTFQANTLEGYHKALDEAERVSSLQRLQSRTGSGEYAPPRERDLEYESVAEQVAEMEQQEFIDRIKRFSPTRADQLYIKDLSDAEFADFIQSIFPNAKPSEYRTIKLRLTL